MRVGAATRKITLPDGFLPTEGFARQIDELHVRALVLEKERRLALLVVELTSLPPEEIKALKAIACAASGAERAFVCVTHTFSAPRSAQPREAALFSPCPLHPADDPA